MSERTRSGKVIPHSSTCMPPIEPPITLSHAGTPRCVASRAWARTMSRMVTTGKRGAVLGCRCAGSIEVGPVEPWQPPMHVRRRRRSSGRCRAPSPGRPCPPTSRPWDARARSARRRGCRRSRRGRRGWRCDARAVERAPGLVGDGHVAERAPALEGERAVGRAAGGTGDGREDRRDARRRSRAAGCARFLLSRSARLGSAAHHETEASLPAARRPHPHPHCSGWDGTLGLPSQVAGPSPSGWMVRAALDASPQR